MLASPNCSNRIFLADDDEDDCMLFEDALKDICRNYNHLPKANDGMQLMRLLMLNPSDSPDILFLDLNMPVKNGFECLREIKSDERLKNIRIVIFSTSFQPETIDRVYTDGADLYVRKPGSFVQLKTVIQKVLSVNWNALNTPLPKEHFVLSAS
jgi:CheY-like chemotaxis protein